MHRAPPQEPVRKLIPDFDRLSVTVTVNYGARIEDVIPPRRVQENFITSTNFKPPRTGITTVEATLRKFQNDFGQEDSAASLLAADEAHADAWILGELKKQHPHLKQAAVAALGSPTTIKIRRGCKPELVYPYMRRGFSGDIDIATSFDKACYYAVASRQVA